MKQSYIIREIPKAWKRPGGTKHRFDEQKGIKLAWGLCLKKQHIGLLYGGALVIDIFFGMPIVKGLSEEKRKLVQGSYHDKRPDLDNLTKLILDIAQGICFHNDSQIAKISAEKRYDINPRIEFSLTEMRQ